jgi:acyl-CoA dehydrogenase
MFTPCPTERSRLVAERVEAFVRDVIAPYERDPRAGPHGPSADLVAEMRALAREAGLMTPHILPDGSHMTQLETAAVLKRSGLSPLGPVAVNTMAPDEGNMFLLGKAASPDTTEGSSTRWPRSVGLRFMMMSACLELEPDHSFRLVRPPL